MKITIITGPFEAIPPYSFSAVEKRWYKCAQEFKKRGNNVLFISKKPSDSVNDTDDYIYIKGYGRSGNNLKDKVWRDFVYSVRALNRVKRCDVLVLNTAFTPILAPFYKRRYKVAIYNVARMPKGQMSLYSGIDMLSCVSSSARGVLLNQSPRLKDKSCVISNPIDTECFYYEPKKCSEKPKVIYSGRINPKKGIDILCESIEKLNEEGLNIGLTLVGTTDIAHGGGGDNYIRILNSLAKSYKIEYIGVVRENVLLAKELRKGDIFCYPSVAEMGETFGVAPLEAMALGLPTVLSSLACFTDFAKDGESALFFDHRDKKNRVNQLSHLIRQLVEDKSLFERISIGGAESARAFSTEKIASKYISLFEELISKK